MESVHTPIGVPGTITEGEHAGWRVRVDEDTHNTGGYLIIITPAGNFRNDPDGADYWVESLLDLDPFFTESNWNVTWDHTP